MSHHNNHDDAQLSDVELVKKSWEPIAADLPAAGRLFYTNLFTRAPELRGTVFRNTDVSVQSRRLMEMVNGAVGLLDKPGNTLVETLQKTGVRHIRYGVVNQHYDVVGANLIETLRQALGDAFTPATEAAWKRTYSFMAETMIKAAEEAAGISHTASQSSSAALSPVEPSPAEPSP
jgi:hemoglobin-like flavoprotein